MIKNITRLEHKIGDRVYHLLADMDSPIPEVREVLNVFLNVLDQIEAAAKKLEESQSEDNQEVVNDATMVEE